jgi:hypothetical protein
MTIFAVFTNVVARKLGQMPPERFFWVALTARWQRAGTNFSGHECETRMCNATNSSQIFDAPPTDVKWGLSHAPFHNGHHRKRKPLFQKELRLRTTAKWVFLIFHNGILLCITFLPHVKFIAGVSAA